VSGKTKRKGKRERGKEKREKGKGKKNRGKKKEKKEEKKTEGARGGGLKYGVCVACGAHVVLTPLCREATLGENRHFIVIVIILF